MRYLVLATDYDGTLAHDGRVDQPTLDALKRCRDSGRKLVLVTGREIPDLQTVFDGFELFDLVVAENGALLYNPATKQEKPLAECAPAPFRAALVGAGVPCSFGRVIVATWLPHDKVVMENIQRFGLELQVIFNKGAVMILPSGVNKASGLKCALDELHMSLHNVVSVGDAENDHALLASCEAGVAVANALPMLKERADLVTVGDHGAGVTELIDRLVDDDLASLDDKLTRHRVVLGNATSDDHEVTVRPFGERVLVTGRSGRGKSTLTNAFLERLAANKYQFCVFDPEGDYDLLESAVAFGNHHEPPNIEQLAHLLETPASNAIANLVGVPLDERPKQFVTLLSRILDLRSRLGHPHWMVIDEAHHVLPTGWKPSEAALPKMLDRTWFVTLEANLMSPLILAEMDTVIAVGENPAELLEVFSKAVGEEPPACAMEPAVGEVVIWRRSLGEQPYLFKVKPGELQQRRHSRKYAEGEVDPEHCFYYRGPEKKLNLRAHNLRIFLQLGEGVDDETWLHHLHEGDYSQWFREVIKDPELADAAKSELEVDGTSAAEGRKRIRELVEERYVLPTASAK